ncbi:MAG: hypothetical protein RR646_02900 [Erysipelotrichaceae bacterium]
MREEQVLTAIIFCVLTAIYIMLSIILYVYYHSYINNKNTRLYNDRKIKFTKYLEILIIKISNNQEIENSEITKIRDKLFNPIYFSIFCETINNYIDNNVYHESTIKLLANFEMYLTNKFINLNPNNHVNYAYLIYQYSIFDYHNERYINKLCSNIEDNSIYVRVGTLRAIAKLKEIDKLIYLLQIISLKEIYIGSKVIIDILDDLNYNEENLNKLLLDNLKSFNIATKCDVIEHFNHNKYIEASDILFKLLAKNELELNITIIRYFNAIKDERIVPYLLKFMDSPNWEERSVAVKCSEQYRNKLIETKLVELMKDRNWYVRSNSANIYINESNIVPIMEELKITKDEFQKDIILYTLFKKHLMNYEDYQLQIKGSDINE